MLAPHLSMVAAGLFRIVRNRTFDRERLPDQRALAATLLEETEFDVIECDSAEAALDVLHAREDPVALVFTDVRLAGPMDGVELARILDSDCPDTSVVVTSGDPRDRLGDLP